MSRMKGAYALLSLECRSCASIPIAAATAMCVLMDDKEGVSNMQGPEVRDTNTSWKLPWTLV